MRLSRFILLELATVEPNIFLKSERITGDLLRFILFFFVCGRMISHFTGQSQNVRFFADEESGSSSRLKLFLTKNPKKQWEEKNAKSNWFMRENMLRLVWITKVGSDFFY